MLGQTIGHGAQRGIEDEGATCAVPILGVDVRRDLLQQQQEPRVKLRLRGSLGIEQRQRVVQGAVRVAVRDRVSVEMIDEARIESQLPLQVRSDGAPDETGQTRRRRPVAAGGDGRMFHASFSGVI